MKKLLLLLLLPASLFAQGVQLENFSQGTPGAAPTSTDMGNALYGTLGTCCFVGQTPFTAISNSNSTLTYTNTSACSDGGPPASINGVTTHSGLILDYNTTNGGGHSNQIIFIRSPNEVGTITMGGFWFCTDIPVTDAFGTTNDFLQVIGGSSRLANFNSNGSSQNFGIEACTGPCQGTIPRGTVGTTLWVAWQHVQSAACVNADHTDCIRLAIYNRNLQLVGEEDASVGAGVINYQTLGNGNSATMSTGHHMQFSDNFICWIGCTANMFPLLPNNPWLGILSQGHAIDYTKAGISGGIPSGSWSQCVTTACNTALAAGTSATTAQINAALSSAPSNTHVDIAAGTYNFSTGQITFPNTGHVELRSVGNGADFVFSGSAGGACNRSGSAFICEVDAANANITGTPTLQWASGYAQGTTATVLSNGVGINTTSAANPTLLVYNQCDTGLQGNIACSVGSNTDNGNLFISEQLYAAGVGCCGNGPGNTITNRGEAEIHVATSTSGSLSSNVTLSIPISNPNYASGQQPAVLPIQSVSMFGLNNIRVKDPQVGAAVGISFQNAYNWWVVGGAVEDSNSHLTWGFNCLGCANGEFQSNYVYHISGNANPYGVRCMMCSYNLWDNNIIQQSTTPFSFDGSSVGNVIAYNFVPNATFFPSSNVNQASFNSHAINLMDLYESNLAIEYVSDGIHGTQGLINNFRNGYLGWWSQPSNPVTSTTNSRQEASFSRYSSDTFGLYGASLYHTTYFQNASCTNASKAIFLYGVNCAYGNVPTDSLSGTTALRYGNYDIKRAGVGWCGNARNSNFATFCASATEVPAAASIFPNTVPVIGDTAAGQPGPPASFYLTARPSWYSNSIPFPAMGPDITSGNLGQCGGTINTVGQFAGMPATNSSQCAGQGLNALWGSHANAIPAASCAYQLGMPPDGSGSELTFNYGTCYGGTVSPIATFSPASLNIGQVPVGLTSNPSVVITLTNTGTANLVATQITMANTLFAGVNNTCGTSGTFSQASPGAGFTLAPGLSCQFQVTASGGGSGPSSGAVLVFDNTSSSPDTLPLSVTFTGPPAPAVTIFAGNVTLKGSVLK